jgi:DNA polymerase III subunit epsilon
MSLLDQPLRDIPLAVIDFETTGLSAKSGSRVVEVSIVRVEPGRPPELMLDTLIDPEGPVLCTSIHGISDEDVLGAPRFSELLGDVVLALEGSLVGAYNASFDMSFLSAEAQLARRSVTLRPPPHVCLMWLRPLIGLSKRCTLDAACQQHGLRSVSHRAAEDALACAHMWKHYIDHAENRGLRTLEDLTCAGTHKYLSTLSHAPYTRSDFHAIGGETCGTAHKPRFAPVVSPVGDCPYPETPETVALARKRAYWQALIDALSDGVVTSNERDTLLQVQTELRLTREEIRAAHARLFADRLREYAEDDAVSLREAEGLTELQKLFTSLGWAPGAAA